MSVLMTARSFMAEGLTPAKRLILLCLSEYADDRGVVWCEIEDLERMTCMKADVLRERIASMVNDWLLAYAEPAPNDWRAKEFVHGKTICLVMFPPEKDRYLLEQVPA